MIKRICPKGRRCTTCTSDDYEGVQVEIMTVGKLKGTGVYKSLVGTTDIIPDPSVKVLHKRTVSRTDLGEDMIGCRIFVNPQDYTAMKEWDTTAILGYLSLLKEVRN